MKAGKPTILAGLVLLAAAIAVPISGSHYALGLAFNLAMWIALTQSWSMLSATTGYVSLGHAVFFGLGSYALVLTIGVLPLPLALLVSAATAAGFALLAGLPVLRVKGPYFVILTFGIAELIKHVVMRIESSLGQFSRLVFDAPPVETLYLWMLGLAVLATLCAHSIRHSRFGRGLIAIREDEIAAETVGVPVTRLKLFAFVASAAIPGAVGGLVVLRTSYFEPSQAFDPLVSFSIVTMAIVGGSDDARGPILGAIGFVLLSELLWSRLPQLYMIILGLMLILFILFIPRGLAGLLDRRGPVS